MDNVQSLDADLAAKAALKHDPQMQADAQAFLERVSATAFDADRSFADNLRNGVILCKTINEIMPDHPIKYSESKMAFKQMENIHMFLERITELGVPSFESFQTVDLYEAKNINQVVGTIFSLSRHAEKRGFQGPRLGPKLTDKVERHFTPEQLAQGKAAVPLLQKNIGRKGPLGVSIGGRRDIGGSYASAPAAEQDDQAQDDFVVVEDSAEIISAPSGNYA